MTNFKKLAVGIAALAVVAVGSVAFAQDDLDDLLKDLEGDTPAAEAKPAAVKDENKAEEKAEVKAEGEGEEKAEAKAEEKPAEEAKTEEKAEEKPAAEEVKAEEKAEEKPAEETKTEEKAEGEGEEKAEEKPAEEAKTEEKTEEKPAEEVKAEGEEKAEEKAEGEEAKAEEKVEAEAKPAEEAKVEESKPVSPDAELLSNVMATEVLRRRSFDEQAKREIRDARRAMNDMEYTEAARFYGNALKLLNDSPTSKNLRRECEQGVAEGLYRAALQEYRTGRRDRAIKLVEKAIDMRHPKARKQLEFWLADKQRGEEKLDVSQISHRKNEKDYVDQRKADQKLLKRARQLESLRDLDAALEKCEMVLAAEPYNQEAIRLRAQIIKKQQLVLDQERDVSRDGMIAEVGKKWRPVYAPNAKKLGEVITSTQKRPLGNDPERSVEQDIINRMKNMRLPTISFKPPATIIDAVEFFRGASKDYDNPEIPLEKRGFNFVLKTPEALKASAPAEAGGEDDGFAATAEDDAVANGQAGVPVIPMITASDVSFHEALKLVCDSVNYKFKVQGKIVMVMQKDMTTDEMVTRSYPVLGSFIERMGSASTEMKEMRQAGFGGGAKKEEGEENQEKDWKAFFEMMGVQWPEGSTIMYIKTIGKLRVKNTYDNLAELEKALTELNVDQKLIEIEARFVEVCQEDLNSLGFEWILNSDYTIGMDNWLGKGLRIGEGTFEGARTLQQTLTGYTASTTTSGGTTTQTLTPNYSSSIVNNPTSGAKWIQDTLVGATRGIGVNSTTTGNGTRYLSTKGNHISGDGNSSNDQFMKINAFIGNADLSMILHMLSQRSDTDLLSSPKVLTKPGEEAIIKVVTEYIYPTDYDVQLQSSGGSSSGGSSSSSSGGSSMILAVVEPQSFTMREVGVILDVTPTLTDDGNLIDLKLNTQVVDEPTWKNYGMKIPFSGNTSSSVVDFGGIFTGLSTALATIGAELDKEDKQVMAGLVTSSALSAMESLSSKNNVEYYNAPMEQPFFHVRSIDSSVSINPGSTIVMGGLITEQRKAMDDKVPFLGDIPYIGRLFRSHSEWTNKRNLLIFVTTRLVDVRGREVTLGSAADTPKADVKPAPAAE